MRAVARATAAMARPTRFSRASGTSLHHAATPAAAAATSLTCLCRTAQRALSTDAASTASATVAAAASEVSAPAVASASAASGGAAAAERGPRGTERKKSKSSAPAGNWSPIKGTHDYFPAWSSRQRALESLLSLTASQYAYGEVRTPMLERSDLFARSLGADSDVVSKEMFLFDDHGTSTVLRPENTASQRKRVNTRIGFKLCHRSNCSSPSH